ncbi:MAG TPA: lipid-binding protein [Chitinophagaceae bacterium]|jgi:lipid-binding putative hydrolase|nr:lipid-binding protein [Chitinophagaceae bacterium]
MKKIFLLPGAIMFLLCSCKKDLPEVGKTAAEKMANEWWVTLDQGGTQDVFGIGHFKIATYNSSANDDSIWIDDFQNGWQVKFKAKADYSNLTFAATNAANQYYPITVTLTDGKVLLNTAHSKSGNVVDSIHMQLEFSDDPGTIYEMNGGARTRFAEDDY